MKRTRHGLLRFTDNYEVREKIILRDHLALQRTKLANERTLLTYIRSALYLIIAGIAFLNMEDFAHVPYLGFMCLVFSGILFLVGILRYMQLKRQINQMYRNTSDKQRITE